MSIFKTLLEIADSHKLAITPEFKAVKSAAPAYADKLLQAWDGDVKDYEKAKAGKVELLFPQMLSDKALEKFAQNLKTGDLKNQVAKLKHLHTTNFPAVKKFQDKSIWAHEPLAKESLEESKMSELDANIRELFKPDENILSIQKPSIHSFKSPDGIRQFVVHGVTYNKKSDKSGEPRSRVPAKKAFKSGKQEYQEYVYHPVGSIDVKRGLPRKKGGEIKNVDEVDYLKKKLKSLEVVKPQDEKTKKEIDAVKAEIALYK